MNFRHIILFIIQFYFTELLLCGENNLKWIQVESPVKSRLTSIKMFSSNEGYISGASILQFNDKKWELINPQPPAKIDKFCSLGKNKIWISSQLFTYQSDLYFFNGKIWAKQKSPLANSISYMKFNEQGTIWLCSWGELAYFKSNKWRFFIYPPCQDMINEIIGDDENYFYVLAGDQLYLYESGFWINTLPKEKIISVYQNEKRIVAHTGNKILIQNNNRWKVHSESKLLSEVNKLAIINEKNIWGIGSHGILIHYDGNGWKKIALSIHEDLQDIQMLSDKEGWIVGDKGTILYYGNLKLKAASEKALGFDQIVVYPFGREVNDEYGVAIEDIDNDGLKDIYAVCIFDPNRLYINRSDFLAGKITHPYFPEEASLRGVNGVFGHTNENEKRELYLGIGCADIDNDYDQDLYLCNLLGKNKLFLNNGEGYFRNVSDQENRGVGEDERTNTSIFGDVDNDGDLDMFITNEYTSNRLFLNDGNGYFNEITIDAGLKLKAVGMCAAFGDIDNDDDLDLFVSNWFSGNVLYRNEYSQTGKVKFTNITSLAGVEGEIYSKSNGVAFADIDNDGDLDLFVANRKLSNRFYVNNGTGKFSDKTDELIGLDSMYSYSVSFADFDQDGYQDLYLSNIGRSVLYKNVEGKNFIRMTSRTGAQHDGYSTGTSVGDIDNDGDMDLYCANFINDNSVLFINNLNSKNYIKLKIKGTKSNADAIGTKVWLYKSGKLNDRNFLLGYREINSGTGYASHSSTEVHFGVKEEELYDILIHFPSSGINKIYKSIKPGTFIFCEEEVGIQKFITTREKAFLRLAGDPEVRKEIIKFVLLLVVIIISNIKGIKKYAWGSKFVIPYTTTVLFVYIILNLLFLYESYFLSIILPLSSSLIIVIVVHLWYERIIMKKLSLKEKQETRDRIARDLHDDLASNLSSVLIYSEALKRSITNKRSTDELLTKINTLLIESTDSITDIVWTVSPKNDYLDELLMRLRLLVTDLCSANNIQYEIDFSSIKPDVSLQQNIRRNIFLIFKEALNNSIKYSCTKSIMFNALLVNDELKICFKDSGIGLNNEEVILLQSIDDVTYSSRFTRGNGIRNMLFRAKEINADLTIESIPVKGVTINLFKKMTQMDY